MADNMRFYAAGRSVPSTAVKPITGGAYGKAGLSDINPQWRIEKLTEMFGPCGNGWYIEPDVWTQGEIIYAHVKLYYKDGEAWSNPVHGYGGTKLTGFADDDAVKSTITDAFGNACRYLGIGADVWLKQYDTKNSAPPVTAQKPQEGTPNQTRTSTSPQARNASKPAPAPATAPHDDAPPPPEPPPEDDNVLPFNGTNGAGASTTTAGSATTFQRGKIKELCTPQEYVALEAMHGPGLVNLTFAVAVKHIGDIKTRKGIK